MKLVKAPEIYCPDYEWTIFLAGSIDMGKAENWQDKIVQSLADTDITIFNPRRDDWDSSWVQDISNEKFKEQVMWELEHIESVDMVVFYFDPDGPAPITLLELGLCATSPQKVVVCCPPGYWRRGNVQIVCNRHSIKMVDDIEDLISSIKAYCV